MHPVYHVIVEPGFWDKLAAVGTVVAFLAVALTFIFSALGQRVSREQLRLIREGQKQDREIAESTAARAESAARVSVEYSERIVAALETLAAKGLTVSSVPLVVPPAPKVKWSLIRTARDAYRLTNEGDAGAYNVVVEHDESLDLIELPDGPVDIRSGEAIGFYAAVTFGTRDLTVTVTWSDDDGDDGPRRDWKYPLPH